MAINLSEQLKGVLPPVITPLTPERRLDTASAESVYRFMLDKGAHGLFLFGTSGEGPLLCEADRHEATEIAVKVVNGSVPLLVGVIAPGTEQIIEQAKVVKAQGADAIVVCPPYYTLPDRRTCSSITARFGKPSISPFLPTTSP